MRILGVNLSGQTRPSPASKRPTFHMVMLMAF